MQELNNVQITTYRYCSTPRIKQCAVFYKSAVVKVEETECEFVMSLSVLQFYERGPCRKRMTQ